MPPNAWTRPLADGAAVQVVRQPEDSTGAVSRYRLDFPAVVGDIVVTGDGRLAEHTLGSEDGRPVSTLDIAVPNALGVERVIADRDGERVVVHLPGGELLAAVDGAIDGDDAAAERALAAFDTPVQVPLVCGSFLDIDDAVALLAAVVRADRHAQSQLHSYRYAVVRAALADHTGLHVGSAAELEALVDGLDAIEAIGPVSTVDALADAMATIHGSVADTDRLLEALGYDAEALEDVGDGLLASCYLAQRVVRAGVDAAEDYELRQDLPSTGDYDRRKRAALRSDYGERGAAWRRLLVDARRQSPAEFRSVLANTLYWTAKESRSDSRLAELLHRAAETVAARTGDRRVEKGARYGRWLAAGHRLRGTHCYRPAAANFERAERLAADYEFLEEWRPILAGGLVRARLAATEGDHGRAVDVLDETIGAVLDADPPKWAATRSMHHLSAQKCETQAEHHGAGAPRLARNLLGEAETHYELIGFERSLDRVRRKRGQYAEAAAAEAAGGPTAERPDAAAEAPPDAVPWPQASETAAPDSGQPPGPTAGEEPEPAPVAQPEPDDLDGTEYPEPAEEAEYSDRYEEPYRF